MSPRGFLACLFRGQADAKWDLRPSVARFIRDGTWTVERAIETEKLASELFGPAAQPHLSELERDPQGLVEWWSVKQHYGIPTRALDWSTDPYVALYFAVEAHPQHDGALWFVHANSVQQRMQTRYGSKRAPDPPGPRYYCYPAAPQQLFLGDVLLGSLRKDAQRGMFSWCRRVSSDHATVIASALRGSPEPENLFRRLIIPARRKARAPRRPCRRRSQCRAGVAGPALRPGRSRGSGKGEVADRCLYGSLRAQPSERFMRTKWGWLRGSLATTDALCIESSQSIPRP